MRAKTLLASTLVTTAITIIGCSLVEDNRIESLRMVKEAKMEVLEAHKLAKEYVEQANQRVKEAEEQSNARLLKGHGMDDLVRYFMNLDSQNQAFFIDTIQNKYQDEMEELSEFGEKVSDY
ncbi:hypothetical protein [Candidatus Liberibacter asiaticus]|uniref:hypothetical protein n=1 Tax=Liberibacter asiaticus TaxID=34021 RepID=UPI0012F4AE3D|nr:hypothetical protein [Candidatus Liberibacter asiaticus]KAE9510824.1 hypothetical protein FXW31_04720 [Candidatus Liberibacter asiaticus]